MAKSLVISRSKLKVALITVAIVAIYCLDLVLYFHTPSVALGKALLLFLGSAVFFMYRNTRDRMKVNNIDAAVLVFIFLLAFRLVVDFVFKGIHFFVYNNTLTVFVFYAGLAIFPYIYFSRNRCAINPRLLVVALYIVFLFALAISLKSIINGSAEANTSDRFSGEGGFSILYGHLGVSLFFILPLPRRKSNRIPRIC